MEEDLGILLPFNVVVSTADTGETTVAAPNPVNVLSLSFNEDIKELVLEIKARVDKAIGNM